MDRLHPCVFAFLVLCSCAGRGSPISLRPVATIGDLARQPAIRLDDGSSVRCGIERLEAVDGDVLVYVLAPAREAAMSEEIGERCGPLRVDDGTAHEMFSRASFEYREPPPADRLFVARARAGDGGCIALLDGARVLAVATTVAAKRSQEDVGSWFRCQSEALQEAEPTVTLDARTAAAARPTFNGWWPTLALAAVPPDEPLPGSAPAGTPRLTGSAWRSGEDIVVELTAPDERLMCDASTLLLRLRIAGRIVPAPSDPSRELAADELVPRPSRQLRIVLAHAPRADGPLDVQVATCGGGTERIREDQVRKQLADQDQRVMLTPWLPVHD